MFVFIFVCFLFNKVLLFRSARVIISICGFCIPDKEIKTEIDRLHVPGAGYSKISRSDVARFMLMCLATDKYDKKMVAIRV